MKYNIRARKLNLLQFESGNIRINYFIITSTLLLQNVSHKRDEDRQMNVNECLNLVIYCVPVEYFSTKT